MHIKNAEKFRPQLEALLARHSPQPVDLMIVPSISEWTASRNCLNGEGDPPARAVRDLETGGWGILIRQEMHGAQVRSIIDGMEISGRNLNASSILSSPLLFLQHTALHELAHLANNWGQDRESDCDDWAFERLLLEFQGR